MALSFHPRLLITLALLAVAHCSSIPSASTILGGYVPIDPKDPHVIEIAKFAVDKYNKLANSDLVYKTVFKAEKQLLSGGNNYRIGLTVKHDNVKANFQAIVFEALSGYKCLDEFNPLLK